MQGHMEHKGPKVAREVSRGTCYLCGSTFSKASMTRHLQACRQLHPQSLLRKGRERMARLFHLTIEGGDRPKYWLHVEAPADTELRILDSYLRDVWLECCGHLSAFTIGKQHLIVEPQEPGEEGMDVALERLLDIGSVFSHEYDFGSTTELRLKVVGERIGVAKGTGVQLLARNDPPQLRCQQCGEPAAAVCTECSFDSEAWLCGDCAGEHPCGEELLLPVVNSPRVGTCGYGA